MRSIYYFLVFFIMALPEKQARAQQSFTYNQYMNTLTPYNTAYSLVNKGGAVNILGRKQWVGINGAPTSFVFSGSLPLEKIASSVGAVAMHDQFGIEKLTELTLFYAKSVRLSEQSYLAASINAGLRNYNAAYSQLDSYDPKFSNDIRENTGTIGLGIIFFDPNRFYIGASLPRLSMRSLGNASIEDQHYYKQTWYFSGAYLQDINEDMSLKAASLISYTRSLPAILDVSATLYFKRQLGIGIGYRSTGDVIGLVSWVFSNNLNVGYSYQSGLGRLKIGGATSSTHEISLGLRFGSKEGGGIL